LGGSWQEFPKDPIANSLHCTAASTIPHLSEPDQNCNISASLHRSMGVGCEFAVSLLLALQPTSSDMAHSMIQRD
jgi:hypothetical protein